MHRINRIMISTLSTAGLYLMSAGLNAGEAEGRMKNVVLLSPGPSLEAVLQLERPVALSLPAMEAVEVKSFIPAPEEAGELLETTIEGGMTIKNETEYFVDAAELIAGGPGISLPEGEPQILIIHTHSSEAYTQAGLDRYEPSDSCRTEDTQFNVVRIGDELTEILTEQGLNVIHDRGIYDYPSYTGSYSRSGAAVAVWFLHYIILL